MFHVHHLSLMASIFPFPFNEALRSRPALIPLYWFFGGIHFEITEERLNNKQSLKWERQLPNFTGSLKSLPQLSLYPVAGR